MESTSLQKVSYAALVTDDVIERAKAYWATMQASPEGPMFDDSEPDRLQPVDLSRMFLNPFNYRRVFAQMPDIVRQIEAADGLLEDPQVKVVDGQCILQHGARRALACVILYMLKIEAGDDTATRVLRCKLYIPNGDEVTQSLARMLHNTTVPPDAYDQGMEFLRWKTTYGYTDDDIVAKSSGAYNLAFVQGRLILTDLSTAEGADVLSFFRSGRLGIGDAQQVARLPPEQQSAFCSKAVGKILNGPALKTAIDRALSGGTNGVAVFTPPAGPHSTSHGRAGGFRLPARPAITAGSIGEPVDTSDAAFKYEWSVGTDGDPIKIFIEQRGDTTNCRLICKSTLDQALAGKVLEKIGIRLQGLAQPAAPPAESPAAEEASP